MSTSLVPHCSSRAIAILFLSFLVCVALPAGAVPPDLAARGLDLFVHVAPSAAAGRTLEVNVQAFGFPEVTRTAPLAGATIEVGWDPESLGGQPAPPDVVVKADDEGRGRATVTLPITVPEKPVLLVGARYGAHARTQSVAVTRAAPAQVELHVADDRVVPRSTVSAWVRVVGVAGDPLPKAGVVVSLVEAGVARWEDRAKTDAGGLVLARVPIPSIDEPVWSWTLRAVADVPGATPAEIVLRPREETPGKPSVSATWSIPPSGALAGDKMPFAIRLRDAVGQPVASHELRYWIGPKGTTPPANDQAWEKQGIVAKTNGLGIVSGERTAPTLVKIGGTSLTLAVRAELEGHELTDTAQAIVGTSSADISVLPEAGSIIPGIAQHLAVRVYDARGDGVEGTFQVRGDGLDTTATTDERGEAEVMWTPPDGVGATRNVGPCAGGVAAAVVVKPTKDLPALRGRESFSACVSVDRDAAGIVRVVPDVARPGDRVRVSVSRRTPDKRAASVIARGKAQASSTWLPGGSGEIVLPPDAAAGVWDVSVATPETSRASRVLGTRLLVVPRIAPALVAKRIGGRATPGGSVEIEAQLTDGNGHGLPGSISAVVVDAFGGSSANVSALDTRKSLCAAVGALDDRCDAVLAGAKNTEALRRALLGGSSTAVAPAYDPGASVKETLDRAFADVVKSLEGAVFEATKNPNTLTDVRRKERGRWMMNPELLTLATDAMGSAPLTPGGEPLTLPDLVAIDPQVTFDAVARRVTRLKVFRVLSAVRDVRAKRNLDPDEPVFKDPNALLRRMVRDGSLTEDALLDPWGGTLQFVRANGNLPPFLATIRGWELRAPGPDGLVSTADDVSDPFERVVRSQSPYANAVQEDRLVDAKWDMVVSEDTVRSWDSLFTELTGTALGLGGMGTVGYGSGGGGGAHMRQGATAVTRGTSGVTTGDAYWSPPVRTDAEGRVKLTVPLGDVETTWRIALVGAPDGSGPASTTLDVASDIPISARVNAGVRWIANDVVDVDVVVRNRTDAVRAVSVAVKGEGVALVDGRETTAVPVPAHGASVARFRVRATRAGSAALLVTTHADGIPDDVVHHAWEVAPAGEKRILTRTEWVEGKRELSMSLDHGYVLSGKPRIVLERGYEDALAAALDSLEPERQPSAAALADAMEAAAHVERWATTRPSARDRALAAIANAIGKRAHARFAAFAVMDETSGRRQANAWTLHERIRALTHERRGGCPPDGGDAALDVEPAPGPEVKPCWGAYVANAERSLMTTRDATRLARALLAVADKPHRAPLATKLAQRLREVAKLDPAGELAGGGLDQRADRATVYAALLRGSQLGASPASAPTIFAKLAALRDATGGYGSSAATLAVVRALVTSQLAGHGATHARVGGRTVDVPESGSIAIDLPENALSVVVETEGPGAMVRFERPALRLFTHPPPPSAAGIGLEVIWPAQARSHFAETLRVIVHNAADNDEEVDVRIPLPPGASLAAPVAGATQIEGVLRLRQTTTTTGALVELPIRFALAGTVTVPEATARASRSASTAATAPSRVVQIR